MFEFEILNSCNLPTSSNWFIVWLAKDLNQFKKFCQFFREKPNLQLLLDPFRDKIVEVGRLKGFHSKLSYDNCESI